ncbi:MAG: hypothetical protein ACRDLN_02530 [Solirubrobacteraceae bacterium]
MHVRAGLSLAALLVAVVTGCGGSSEPSTRTSDDAAKIRATVRAWYAATARADGAAACRLMTPGARQRQSQDGPEVVITQAGKLEKIPRSCAVRLTRASKADVVDKGIGPTVNHAVVTKIDTLAGRATVRIRVGKGEQVMALTKSGSRWMISGFVTG